MTSAMTNAPGRMVVAASIALTLVQISCIEASWLLAIVLPVQWLLIFRPIERREWAMFAIVAPFFVVQNHLALRAGAFAFRQQDFLLMPWHEPLLWMGWYLHLVRFVRQPGHSVHLAPAAWVGLLVTVLAFSLFGSDMQALTIATAVSSTVLLILFHSAGDLAYALCAAALGLLVECTGVASGLWYYPDPGPLPIPLWSLAMWLSVGLLGRRFVVPLADKLASQGDRHA